MKKITITFLAVGLLFVSGLKAQSIPEGVNHLNSGRVNSAIKNFEKMLALNPNNIEAIYWLGQSYLDLDEIAGARIKSTRELYEKGLQTTVNAPLLLVGMGHVELLENKTTDARQHFETALTMTRTKKGDDQSILVAVGRANVDAKAGDYNYAIEKLKAAADKGEKNPEIFLQLGNAYRKAGQGNGGGAAFESYKKALELSPNFAIASLRLAKLFESQKNWELVLQYLNEATTKDAKFTTAYYDLFYYYFYRGKFPEAEEYLKKYIDSKLPESDIQDQFLYGQLCYARKDFDCAISKGEAVVASTGQNTKPKVYRMLAYAYFDKKDYTNAKKFSDDFFVKKNPDDYKSNDHKLRADIMSQTGGSPEEIYVNYIQGADLDTTIADKIDFLKKGVAYFKERKIRDKEALLLQKIIDIKAKPTINDYFDLTLAHYFTPNYVKSRETALLMRDTKFPDQVYGYDWAYNVSILVDTVKKDSIALPDALKLYEFSQKDTAKFRKQYINSVRYLAAYYINVAKDKDKSLEFFTKWLEVDPANSPTIQPIIDQIKKMQTKPAVPPRGNVTPEVPVKTTSTVKTPPATTKKPKTTTTVKKPVVVKK